MKGIIAEISGKYAVVLTQDGAFRRIKASPSMSVGIEIDLEQPAGKKDKIRCVTRITSLAAAGMLALGVGLGAYSYTVPYSYVHVDINPSLELTVNIYDRIIKAEALNSDGKKLLVENNLRNASVETGVRQLLSSAVRQGYLKSEADDGSGDPAANVQQTDEKELKEVGEGQQTDEKEQQPGGEGQQAGLPAQQAGESGQQAGANGASADESSQIIENAVLLTVSSGNARKSGALKKEIADAASKELDKDRVKSEILVGEASVKQRDEAKEYGVTPGKLVLIEDALGQEPALQMDKLKKTAIKDLLKMVSDRIKDGRKQAKEDEKQAETDEKQKEQDGSKAEKNSGKDRTGSAKGDIEGKEGKDGKEDKEGKVDKEGDGKETRTDNEDKASSKEVGSKSNNSKDADNDGGVKNEEKSSLNAQYTDNSQRYKDLLNSINNLRNKNSSSTKNGVGNSSSKSNNSNSSKDIKANDSGDASSDKNSGSTKGNTSGGERKGRNDIPAKAGSELAREREQLRDELIGQFKDSLKALNERRAEINKRTNEYGKDNDGYGSKEGGKDSGINKDKDKDKDKDEDKDKDIDMDSSNGDRNSSGKSAGIQNKYWRR